MAQPPAPSWNAELELDTGNPATAERVCRAFAPETGDLLGKSTVSVDRREGTVLLRVSADSTSNLRAALNSYLRWLEMALKVDDLAAGRPGRPPVP